MTQLPRPVEPRDEAFSEPPEASHGNDLMVLNQGRATAFRLPGESGAWISSEGILNLERWS